jgi:hypothetical protein
MRGTVLGIDRRLAQALLVLVLLAVPVLTQVERAGGEQTQRGKVISYLNGELRPLSLPRHRAAPITVHLVGGLRTSDGSLLPRVTRLELGLAEQGVLSTRGLPLCQSRRLLHTRADEALAACGSALVGQGHLLATVPLQGQQEPLALRARLLAFNARIGGRRGIVLQASSRNPPTSAVLPLRIVHGSGRFAVALVGQLQAALGPLPRLARFELSLGRRYRYRGEWKNYLSASCPLPPRFRAGFFSFARASYRFAGGGGMSTAIARGCRAR